MERRNFIRSSATALLLAPHLSAWGHLLRYTAPNANFLPDGFVDRLIWENDRAIDYLIDIQQQKSGHSHYGGIPNRFGLYHAGSASDFIQKGASAWVSPESDYYQSPDLIAAMKLAAEFLNNIQHDDGTIDLLTTNFHSTPDTGFVVEPMCLAYGILAAEEEENAEVGSLLGEMKRFLVHAGDALSKGGIHTPNHRWVVSMALARLNHLFPNTAYTARIEEWLNEKIDIDPDGQYTERSTHIYSPLTNRCLITIARLLDKPELYEPVRRNLEMTLYYVHPNGELVTEASGRQDQYQIGTLQNYWYPYFYMALQDQNGPFAAMANLISKEMETRRLIRNLAYLQEDAGLHSPLPDSAPLPDNYVKSFPHSKLVRIRRGQMDATILADNSTFLTFHKGNAVLQAVRLASAFFGKGQFVSANIDQHGNHFVLRQELTGPYYQPYPANQLPADGNWEKMPRINRPQSEIQQLTTIVEIVETEGKLELRIDIRGTAHVPVALELAFRHDGTLTGVSTVDGVEDAYLLIEGTGTYRYGSDQISFGPGQATHSWTQLRGALPKLDGMCVYLTGETPWAVRVELG